MLPTVRPQTRNLARTVMMTTLPDVSPIFQIRKPLARSP